MNSLDQDRAAVPTSETRDGGASQDGERPARFLLDGEARRWSRLIDQAESYEVLQRTLEAKSGPHTVIEGREFVVISAYDYLGLIGHPLIDAAAARAIEEFGTGTGGVRLLTGTNSLHTELERDLAAFKGTEAAMTFSSGFLANIAVITTLMGPRDRVILDECCHRSIRDACRMADASVVRFLHNDVADLEKKLRQPARGRTLIVIEGIYSMDGDICPLPEIVEMKERFGAFLMVDEAHAIGVLGPTGRGTQDHFGMPSVGVDIWMGSLSKAIPASGGFLAGDAALIRFLRYVASPYVFSAALTPASTAAARAALEVMLNEHDRHRRLADNAEFLRGSLNRMGFDTGTSTTPVIPVLLRNEEHTLRAARTLFEAGILATPVCFPAVPRGAARLRLCASAGHDRDTLDVVLRAFAALTPA